MFTGITDVSKFVGRLRPNFLSTCIVDTDLSLCSPGDYISNYSCLQTDVTAIIDANKSFPSGHASSAAFYAIFFIVSLKLV